MQPESTPTPLSPTELYSAPSRHPPPPAPDIPSPILLRLSLCVSLCLSISVSVCLSLSLSVCLSLSLTLSLSVCPPPPPRLSLSLSHRENTSFSRVCFYRYYRHWQIRHNLQKAARTGLYTWQPQSGSTKL